MPLVPKMGTDMFAGDWYKLCTNIEPRDWFSNWDCFYRYALSFFMFYYMLFTTPISLAGYTYRYNITWYGFWPGLLMTVYFPITPLAIVGAEMIRAFKKWATQKKDWASAGPGSIFFVEPEGVLAKWLWKGYLNLSMYIAIYCACGNDPDAIQASWEDTDTTKTFWRKLFQDSQVRYPRELASWDGKNIDKQHKIDCSVVIKLEDSYLGIGDSFLTYGEDFDTEEDILDLLQNDYAGKEALVLEFVKADPDMGVHQLDIITFDTPEGPKVLHCLLWTHCTGSSSHTTRGGYVVDVESETCVSPVSWYSPFFKTQPSECSDKKVKIPGVKKACEQALRAHANMPFKWCRMVGWDCMLTDKQEIVFFEGNFAGARLPRRFFLSWSHMREAMKLTVWPYASSTTE